jgi:sulfur-carrier protein
MNSSDQIQVKIVAFGIAQEIIGSSSIIIHCEPTLNACKENLKTMFPNLTKEFIQYAVNKQIVSENISLNSHCEIALLPPFSGG